MFEKIKVNSLKYKTSDLPNIAQEEYDLPALTAGIQNQGLNNYVPRKNATVLKNVISISANGANTGATFYQSKEFTVLQDAYAIRWIYSDKILTEDQSLFLVSAISKRIYGSYEWTNKAGWERIKNDSIQLPITSSGAIDFDFMESFISELKEERMRKLNAYLVATGLKDYELTTAEQMVLEEFEHVKWGEFKLGDLFEINPTKYYKLSNQKIISKIGKTPLVSNASINNGVMGFSELKALNRGNSISCSDTTIGTDTMFYQKVDFIGYQHIQHLIPKFAPFTGKIAFFIISVCRTATANKGYGYGNKFNRTTMNNTTISLPTSIDHSINFHFMETFIKAIEKLVIKDVVQYADKRIAATAKLVK